MHYVYLDMLKDDGGLCYAFPVDYLGSVRWNGFATPGFTKPQAELFLRYWNQYTEREDDVYPGEFIEATNTYRFIYDNAATDDDEKYETFQGDEAGRYHIGSWSWTWDDISNDSEDARAFHFLTIDP